MKLVRAESGGTLFHGRVQGSRVYGLSQDVPEAGYALEEVRLLPPVQPTKVVAVGLNYRDHAEELNLELPQGNFNTLAGFIQHKLERMPKKGEEIKLKKVTIIVEKVTKQQIKSVKIIKNA